MRYFDNQYLGLLQEIAVTQVKLKDQHTLLGLAWSFLNPLMTLSLIFVMFRFRLQAYLPNFPIYLLIGMVHVTHFSNSTSNAMSILRNLKSLTTNAVFPKETLVMAAVLANATEFVISMAICLFFASISGVDFQALLLALPLIMLLQFMLVLWVSLLLAGSFVFVGDLNHLYQVFLRLLFFITPVFYEVSSFRSGWAKALIEYNPLTYLMNTSRLIALDGHIAAWDSLGVFFLVNLALIGVALLIFRALEPRFAEHL